MKTQKKTEHTPFMIVKDGFLIAEVQMIEPHQHKNKEFIIRAVNSHEALLNIAKKLQQVYVLRVDSKLSTSDDGNLLDELDETIKQAEGK